MEQAGINKLLLIENKELFVKYSESNTIAQIASGGEVFEISSDFPINLTLQELRGKNSKLLYNYALNLTELNPLTIQYLKRSVYGFIVVMYLNDRTKKAILTPLKYDQSRQDNNISDSYSLSLNVAVSSKIRFIEFDSEPLKWILETGFWNDNNIWLDNAIWID